MRHGGIEREHQRIIYILRKVRPVRHEPFRLLQRCHTTSRGRNSVTIWICDECNGNRRSTHWSSNHDFNGRGRSNAYWSSNQVTNRNWISNNPTGHRSTGAEGQYSFIFHPTRSSQHHVVTTTKISGQLRVTHRTVGKGGEYLRLALCVWHLFRLSCHCPALCLHNRTNTKAVQTTS